MESTPQYDFGEAISADAEAVGQPGRRRFRLLLQSTSQTASIWMEKQQLAGIGDYLQEVSDRLEEERPSSGPDEEPQPFGAIFDLDFQIGQVALGYLESDDLFLIQVFNLETDSATPFLRCRLSRGQCRFLAGKIERVVAGGRPVCPLCQMPMEPEGHACPRTNGHHS